MAYYSRFLKKTTPKSVPKFISGVKIINDKDDL